MHFLLGGLYDVERMPIWVKKLSRSPHPFSNEDKKIVKAVILRAFEAAKVDYRGDLDHVLNESFTAR